MDLNNVDRQDFIINYVNKYYNILEKDKYKKNIIIDFESIYKNNNIFHNRYKNNII